MQWKFEFSFDLILVSLMHLGLFLIYKGFSSNGTSQGGLG
jgi:hypothetical protein